MEIGEEEERGISFETVWLYLLSAFFFCYSIWSSVNLNLPSKGLKSVMGFEVTVLGFGGKKTIFRDFFKVDSGALRCV